MFSLRYIIPCFKSCQFESDNYNSLQKGNGNQTYRSNLHVLEKVLTADADISFRAFGTLSQHEEGRGV